MIWSVRKLVNQPGKHLVRCCNEDGTAVVLFFPTPEQFAAWAAEMIGKGQ